MPRVPTRTFAPHSLSYETGMHSIANYIASIHPPRGARNRGPRAARPPCGGRRHDPVSGWSILIRLVAVVIERTGRQAGVWQVEPAPAVFPMVLGSARVSSRLSVTARRGSALGDRVFGQLSIPANRLVGDNAECVAVTAEAPLARVPDGVDLAMAAAAPTAGLGPASSAAGAA